MIWIDPELSAALDRVPQELRPAKLFDFDDMTGTRERLAHLYDVALREAATQDDVVTTDLVIARPDAPDLTLRVHRPPGEQVRSLPCVYWIHGGGMVIGSPRDDDAKCAGLVERLRCVVLAPDYRLAPEHPYPAPVDDCYEGLTWAVNNAAALGIDAARIAIAGQSAGGGLTAAVGLMARDRGVPSLVLQMLLAPMLDDRNETPSCKDLPPLTIWDRPMNERGWQAFLGELAGAPELPVYASPGRVEDLGGLAPTFVDVGGAEIFRDEAIDYVARLVRGGVPTELHLYPGAYHGYDSFAPDAEASRETWNRRWAALQRAFEAAAPA
jgi:acetyl esterase/lipase